MIVLIGGYTEKMSETLIGKSKGIYILKWNEDSGATTEIGYLPLKNPSYFVYNDKNDCLYVIEEIAYEDTPKLKAFKHNGNGNYTLIDEKFIHGAYPCHIAISPNGKELAVANYGTGNAEVYAIQKNGTIQNAQILQHTGKGVNPGRQEGPHAHMCLYFKNRMYVTDLGLDAVKTYEKGSNTGFMNRANLDFKVPAGSGARHCVFHPRKDFVYVLTEMFGTVNVFSTKDSTLLQTIKLLPDSFTDLPGAAAIRITENGKFLYASERTTSQIIVFKIDKKSGKLELVQRIDGGGKTPRDFNLSPSEKWLLVAGQSSNDVTVFKVDKDLGTLTQSHIIKELNTPTCVLWHKA
ncbi:lactonase family protein [Cellulophaga fucicola]|uniref:lactonase family protein n=1 Tax=Cellulophaga fucicola TaxID=76595 RepID=UPI003EB96D30